MDIPPTLTIRATYPATDGSAPEEIAVDIPPVSLDPSTALPLIVGVIEALARVTRTHRDG